MATYTLHYFNIMGKAEVVRFVFALGNQAYADERYAIPSYKIEGKEGWEALKPKTPFGQMPVLDVTEGGKTTQVAQSRAIERFLAKRLNLLGANDIEAAIIDSIGEGINDIFTAYNAAKKEAEKDAAVAKFFSETLPKHLAFIEAIHQSNGKGYFVGDKPSLADARFVHLCGFFDAQDKVAAALEKTPGLKALRTKVEEGPLKAYLAKRPKSAF
mmetsp:Transcript_27074/g.30192  ORF Transcript_27074/g.30192 Transcript_27074/m.30192 type:complete len:214 (-) Transcript_27074:57-698(-)